ncbi:hypothetical protein SARC_16768, partial [Sphaeroforma arctica JP610]
MGAIGGLLGAIFNSINEHITLARMRYCNAQMRTRRVVEVLVVSVVTSISLFLAGRYLGQCHPIAHQETGRVEMYKSYFCPEGTWNDMATLTTSGNEAVIKTLFH